MAVHKQETSRVVLISDDCEREVAFRDAVGTAFVVERYRDIEAFTSTSRPAPELIVVERRPSHAIASDVMALVEHCGYAAPPIAVVDDGYDPDAEAAALTAGAQEYWVRQMHPPIVRHRVSTSVSAERQRRSDRASASEAFKPIDVSADGSPQDNALRIRKQQNAILAALVEHSPSPLVFRDVEGRHLMLNAATAHIIGRPVDEILGWTLEELGRPWDEIGAHERAVVESKAAITQRRVVEDAHGHSTDRQLTKFPVLDDEGRVFAVGTVDVDLTSLGQAQRALRAQEENFRALVEGSVQGIIIQRDFIPLFVNPSFARMHGFDSPDEVLALGSLRNLIAPDERARLDSYAAMRLRTDHPPTHYEYEALKKDGSAMTLQTIASAVTWRGETAIQATVVDITEQRAAERERRVVEARFRAFFDNSPHAMSIQAADGRYLQENAGARALYAHDVGEVDGKLPHDVWTKDIADNVAAVNAQVRTSREAFEYENEVIVNGQAKWVRVAKFPIVDNRGNLLGIGSIGSDLTERKNADRELRISRHQFQDFASASSDWFWEMGPDLRITSITEHDETFVDEDAREGFNRILEHDPDLGTEHTAAWNEFRDRLQVRAPIRDLELPISDDTGSVVRYARVSAKIMFDDDGHFAGYRGVGTDITDFVRSRRQAELLRAAIDASTDATVLYDDERRVVFSSKRFHEIFSGLPSQAAVQGMTRTEIRRRVALGGGLGDAYGKNMDANRYIEQSRSDEAQPPAERIYANGRAYQRRIEEAGDGGLLLQLHDITDLKQARSDLETYQAELRRLASEVSLAEERERRRIATELHDGAVQHLGLASIRIGGLTRKTIEPTTKDALQSVRELITQSVRELRTLMSELSPPMLYELGLPPALEWLAKHFVTHHALDCSARVTDTVTHLPDDLTVLLFQAARELLMNVVKHANAGCAQILLDLSNGEVELQVHDDGMGMDPSLVRDGRSPSGGFGLFSVRERVQLGGGSFTIESAHPGTVIKIRMPSTIPST